MPRRFRDSRRRETTVKLDLERLEERQLLSVFDGRPLIETPHGLEATPRHATPRHATPRHGRP